MASTSIVGCHTRRYRLCGLHSVRGNHLEISANLTINSKVWDTNTGETLHTLQHNHIVRAIAFPPHKRPQILATGGMEKKLRVFDLSQSASGPENGTANGATTPSSSAPSFEIGAGVHGGTIRSVVWTPDPSVLITACEDKVLRWWDMRSRSSIGTFTLDGPLGSCEMDSLGLNEGEATLSVAAGKNVYFFESNRPATLVKKIETKYEIASVAINGRAGKFVTGSPGDTWVRVWDLETETETGMC
jgi:serine-threonine kinase receptor-associated protein